MGLFDDVTDWISDLNPHNLGDAARMAAGGPLAPLLGMKNAERYAQRTAETNAQNQQQAARAQQERLDAANAQAAEDRKKKAQTAILGAYGFTDTLMLPNGQPSLIGQTAGGRPLIGG